MGIPIMAGAAGIADIWRQRSGRGQDLSLDLRKAIHGINPMYKFMPTINGYPYQLPYFIGNPMGFDLYQTYGGRSCALTPPVSPGRPMRAFCSPGPPAGGFAAGGACYGTCRGRGALAVEDCFLQGGIAQTAAALASSKTLTAPLLT